MSHSINFSKGKIFVKFQIWEIVIEFDKYTNLICVTIINGKRKATRQLKPDEFIYLNSFFTRGGALAIGEFEIHLTTNPYSYQLCEADDNHEDRYVISGTTYVPQEDVECVTNVIKTFIADTVLHCEEVEN